MADETIPVHRDIATALRAAPADQASVYRIQIDAGLWQEKLIIDRPNVHLTGAGRSQTRLRFDAAAGQLSPAGIPWGTWGCATLTVRAPGFRASALSIENGFDYLQHLRSPQLSQQGSNGAQAVALMLDQGADRSLLQSVDIQSHQDTLFVDRGRSLFRECRIAGSVDFVFGAGTAVLQKCTVHSRFRPGKERQGYLAAPSTSVEQEFGLCFLDCALTRDVEVANGSVVLGRPWRPTRKFADGEYGDPGVLGAALYRNCWMDGHIATVGWDEMAYTARDGNRVMLAAAEARFAEYKNYGPGASADPRRRQLSAAQSARYSMARLLGDWDVAA